MSLTSFESEKKTYTLRLFDKKYTIVSSDSEEFIGRIANLTERKIRELMTLNKGISLETAAVIASLQLTESILHMTNENNRLLREIEDGR